VELKTPCSRSTACIFAEFGKAMLMQHLQANPSGQWLETPFCFKF
jgi:hypothetical protein